MYFSPCQRTSFLICLCVCTFVYTARKIGFALFLIRIKDEVKYNNIFDNTFDAHQICDAFAYTFDSNQK